MFNYKTIRDVNFQNQTVLVRADYNVPLDTNGAIVDDLRIRASLPTLQHILSHGAKKVIIISHLGRPEGADPKLSLRPIAERLGALLPGVPVGFVGDVAGPVVEQTIATMPAGAILVMENLRFYPGEKANSPEFAHHIATSTGANLFVQDGFAVIHRAHASTSAITHELYSVAGLLVEREVSTLTKTLEDPARPLYVLIGGAKVEDKAPLIEKFTNLADQIIVGGKIAADGYTSTAENIYVAEDFADDHKLDIGPISTEKITDALSGAKTILWNGTFGQVDDPAFAKSSEALAETIGTLPDCTTIICGGDTTGFVENLQKSHPELRFSLISTGGGAALELLSGAKLPGLVALQPK